MIDNTMEWLPFASVEEVFVFSMQAMRYCVRYSFKFILRGYHYGNCIKKVLWIKFPYLENKNSNVTDE